MDDLSQNDRWRTLRILLGAVGFVLLIACVNVANLMLSRSASRQKELAIRRALGAGGGRIARQLLTESTLLGLLGGVAGMLLALWMTKLLPTILPGSMLRTPFRHIESFSLDGRVFGFALLISCVTGILFGLAPALSGLGRDFNLTLKEGGRGSTEGGGNRLRHALVASEVALALIVLAGAGLMLESMSRLLSVDPGLDAKNVLVMGTPTPQVELYNGPPTNLRFCQQLQESVATLPGIVSVGAISHLPLSGAERRPRLCGGGPASSETGGSSPARICGRVPWLLPHHGNSVGQKAGSSRTRTRLAAPGVIVINEAMAHEYWPNDDPIGRRIKLGGLRGKRPHAYRGRSDPQRAALWAGQEN